jgi:para-aminobenzoate synthetase / 4-amino-4-deoxychorismate lyase
MQIIRDLECSPRGVYTGAIGYLSPRGRGHFNVAIRTSHWIARPAGGVRRRQRRRVGLGRADEYEECLLKASILMAPEPPFRLLETIGYAPETGFTLVERHLDRLAASALYFGFAFDRGEALSLLVQARGDLRGASRVRLLLGRDGTMVCEAVDLLPDGEGPLRTGLAPDPIDPSDVFLYHKTTRRDVYEKARAARPDLDAVILWNSGGEVTEGTEANLVAQIDGRRVTPPIHCGLLAGTFRAELLAAGEIVEQRISIEDLRAAERVWLVNSVRGWREVGLGE